MKRLIPQNPALTLQVRHYSSKKNDAVLLADALGLLSPRKTVKNPSNYRPLIFTNLQKGSVTEHYNEIKKDLLADYEIPKFDHAKQMDGLLVNLRAVSEITHNRVLQKNLYSHVTLLQNEDELIELANLSFYQNRLTLPLLTKFLLNKNLTTLTRLPIDVLNVDKPALAKNGWSETNFTELKVLLMKKFHDLNKPLVIVKLLKENFDTEFLPLIKLRQLTPFYERIIWKFHFDYISLNEASYIKSLGNLRSSFMIWESSSAKCVSVAREILANHTLSALQSSFLRLCSCSAVDSVILSELESGRSPLLSSLKKISVKFKIYEVRNTATESVATRALGYSLIHAMESLVASHFSNWHQNEELAAIMGQLKSQRAEMVHQGVPQPENGTVGVYTN